MYVLSNSVWKQLSQFPWSLSVCKVQRGFSYSNTSRCLPMFQICFHQIMPKILNAWCAAATELRLLFSEICLLSLSPLLLLRRYMIQFLENWTLMNLCEKNAFCYGPYHLLPLWLSTYEHFWKDLKKDFYPSPIPFQPKHLFIKCWL